MVYFFEEKQYMFYVIWKFKVINKKVRVIKYFLWCFLFFVYIFCFCNFLYMLIIVYIEMYNMKNKIDYLNNK